MMEWVSVKERLPEEGVHVITFPHIKEAWYEPGTPWRGSRFLWMQHDGLSVDVGVTHWMPLPSPPGEKE